MSLTEDEAKELAELEAKFGSTSHADLGSKVFSQEAINNASQQASGFPSAIRSSMQNLAQGTMMAIPEAVTGATRLVSPETADYMQGGIDRFNSAMNRGSNAFHNLGDESDGVSKDAANTMYNIGNTLPLALAGGSLPAAAVSGAIGGLQASGEGDDRLDTVAKAGLGAGIGAGVGAVSKVVPYAVGKGFDVARNRLGLNELAAKKAAEQAMAKADEIHNVVRKDVNQIYKELGISKTKLSNEDRIKAANLFKNVKYEMGTKASNQFNEVLRQQAPQEVIDSFKLVHPDTLDEAVNQLKKSKGTLDAAARENPGSLQYYNQLRKMIGNVDGDGNMGAVKDITKVFREKIPGFADAQDLNQQSKLLKANSVSSNFVDAIQSKSYDTIRPAIDEVMSTPEGPELLHKLVVDGLGKKLIQNSNVTPLENLSKSIGKDPLAQSQMIHYIESIGKPETAEKIKALTSFVNATKQAQSQPNSTVGRMVGMKSSELDPAKMSQAISNLLNSKSKFSAEFAKIMQEQVASPTKTEKIFNLLKRAGRGVANTAPAVPGRLMLDTDTDY